MTRCCQACGEFDIGDSHSCPASVRNAIKGEEAKMKPNEAATRRRWWIHKGSSNFSNELQYDVDTDTMKKNTPDEFYDLVSPSDTIEGGTSVIEFNDETDVIISREEWDTTRKSLEIAREALLQIAEPLTPQSMIDNDDAGEQINIARQALKKLGEK